MVVIFSASTDSMSAPHTSRIIGPFLHWLWPGIPAWLVEDLQVGIRKSAHVTEYSVLAWLYWRLLCQVQGRAPWPWDVRLVRMTILLTALYASTDEFHQLFVPSRGSAVTDVMLDTAGAVVAMFILRTWYRFRNRNVPPA